MENLEPSSPPVETAGELTLPECADLGACPGVKDALMLALAGGQGLKVDAGKVKTIGTPMMQLLAAAKRSFDLDGGSGMTVVNASERFSEVSRLLGLTAVLQVSEN
ncbi:MAG TPA: STAS domain-containing protein [Rhizomicrobium sp.]|nr:STAS domain-containing protein [Rhizomicrobium sp.]